MSGVQAGRRGKEDAKRADSCPENQSGTAGGSAGADKAVYSSDFCADHPRIARRNHLAGVDSVRVSADCSGADSGFPFAAGLPGHGFVSGGTATFSETGQAGGSRILSGLSAGSGRDCGAVFHLPDLGGLSASKLLLAGSHFLRSGSLSGLSGAGSSDANSGDFAGCSLRFRRSARLGTVEILGCPESVFSLLRGLFCRPVFHRAVRYPESGAGRAGAAGVESQHRPNPQYLLGVSQPFQSDDLAHGLCRRGNSGQRRRDEELSGIHHVCLVRIECVLSIRLYSDYALGRHQHDSCGDVSAAGISDAQRADRQTLWMADTGAQRAVEAEIWTDSSSGLPVYLLVVLLPTVLLAIRWKGKREPKEGQA